MKCIISFISHSSFHRICGSGYLIYLCLYCTVWSVFIVYIHVVHCRVSVIVNTLYMHMIFKI